MPISAEEYFKREVIKTLGAAKKAIKEVSGLSVEVIKDEMHYLNDELHKSRYPITHTHLKKAINGGGSIIHKATSKAAAAIFSSKEFKKFAKSNANTCFKKRLLFLSDRDLARAFYESTVKGEISQEENSLLVKATLHDVFDFRWGWLPKDVSLSGAKLRVSGNIAYLAQEINLLSKVKIKVNLAGYIK